MRNSAAMEPVSVPRICIFCGDAPESKNREHPLPQWLLRLTGDPNRVVVHASVPVESKTLRFSWSSLTFPACESCNSNYSALESQVSTIVPLVCKRETIPASDYVVLLDWLDKVRVGLWLGQRYLQKNPLQIRPKFAISTRVGARDRMVAVYGIGEQPDGLNAFGVDTLLFQLKPSVFALRVNGVLLLNASWEWMCAARCGFAYPTSYRVDLDTGRLMASAFRWRRQVRHPIQRGLIKPSVLLFQPALHAPNEPIKGIELRDYDKHCVDSAWDQTSPLGPLLRQFNARTVGVDRDEPIEFDEVSDKEARTTRAIASQVYTLQNESVGRDRYVAEDPQRVARMEYLQQTLVKRNREHLQWFRTTEPPTRQGA